MVKDETLKTMATRAGIDVLDDTKFTAFKEGLTSDTEVEVTMPEKWHTFTDDNIAKRDKSKYEEGKVAGLEMDIKQFKTDNSLDFDGKTLSKLVDHIKESATKAAGKEPEAKYKELEDKYKILGAEKVKLTGQLEQKENDLLAFGAKSSLTAALSSKGIDTTIPADNIVTLFMSEFDIVDGRHAKRKGAADIEKDDTTLVGKAHTDVFLTYAETFAKKSSINTGGGGGGNGADKLFTTMTEFNKWKESSKPDQETADKVLINSLKAVERKEDFYKD